VTSQVTLLNYCNYVQWVPDSDVVVAQNRGASKNLGTMDLPWIYHGKIGIHHDSPQVEHRDLPSSQIL